jgi:hypothetical protein
VVTGPAYSVLVNHRDHYANAVRAEQGVGWRMISRGPGYRVGTPTDCLDPVRWMGRAMVGRKRMRLWSCERHAEGLEELRRVVPGR